MQIVMKKLSEIRPYKNNPRNNRNAVGPVAKSIDTFGFKVPVIIDSASVIVAGHTRYSASQKLGLKEIPCIVADDLTDEQVRAFRLADNKTAALAEWDFDLQKNELDSIENIDMSDFGFSENNISLFDFMQNDDFSSTGDKTTFEFTLEFDAEYKPYFDLYVKKTGKSHLADIVKNEVLENA